MMNDPKVGYKVIATVTGLKGSCNAGHKVGDSFEISCYNTGGLCGWLYHDIFPHLSSFQFGGDFPWWEGDTIELECPDRFNLLKLKLERIKREK
ncbi:MAG: TIGR04076 family protein [Deltaproteobacteria bacterium]|nr:TIGR04076 family protein [Deltaproteobacteria bacterium]